MGQPQRLSVRGVTLIELMVVIAVIAILSTIATPALQNFVRDNRVTAQSNELSSLIAFARSQSTASLFGYELRIVNSGDGWSAEVHNLDPNCSAPCVEKDSTFTNTTLTIVTGSLPLAFNDRAVLTSGEITLALQHDPCVGQRQRTLLNVLISGSVRTDRVACGNG